MLFEDKSPYVSHNTSAARENYDQLPNTTAFSKVEYKNSGEIQIWSHRRSEQDSTLSKFMVSAINLSQLKRISVISGEENLQ